MQIFNYVPHTQGIPVMKNYFLLLLLVLLPLYAFANGQSRQSTQCPNAQMLEGAIKAFWPAIKEGQYVTIVRKRENGSFPFLSFKVQKKNSHPVLTLNSCLKHKKFPNYLYSFERHEIDGEITGTLEPIKNPGVAYAAIMHKKKE